MTQMSNNNRVASAQTRRVLLSESSSVCGKLFNVISLLDKKDALGIFAVEEPETVLQEVSQILGAQFTDVAASKLLAGFMAYGTDLVYQNCEAFIQFANTCSNEQPIRQDIYDPANVLECAIAIVEMAVMDAAFEDDEPNNYKFSEEICKYWGAMLLSEGFIEKFPPFQHAIMPPTEREVTTQAMGQYMLSTDGEAKVQIDASLQVHLQRIYNDIKHLTDEQGRLVMTGRDFDHISRSLGL